MYEKAYMMEVRAMGKEYIETSGKTDEEILAELRLGKEFHLKRRGYTRVFEKYDASADMFFVYSIDTDDETNMPESFPYEADWVTEGEVIFELKRER